MEQEKLFASFILDNDNGLEIALPADLVVEATQYTTPITPLPSGCSFLEGLMALREDFIPVVNLKKRFGLTSTAYREKTKVAVVQHGSGRIGLLVDDIKDVMRVKDSQIERINPELLSQDRFISTIIKLEAGKRIVEIVSIDDLFHTDQSTAAAGHNAFSFQHDNSLTQKTYSRYVVFVIGDQQYGLAVANAQEIAFVSEIDDVFQTEFIKGSMQLRGRTIPVLDGYAILGKKIDARENTPTKRIMIVRYDDLFFGLIVDEIKDILTIADDVVLSMPTKTDQVKGICSCGRDRDIMLLNLFAIVDEDKFNIRSMVQLDGKSDADQVKRFTQSNHIITENCYLVFSIGRNFAIELKDIQEIIEKKGILGMPGTIAHATHDVINLRGQILPVVNLRRFYGMPTRPGNSSVEKLIIGRSGKQLVALEVDEIVTIYKQEDFFPPPPLNKTLEPRKDTLDRVIEFQDGSCKEEHVLVLNIHNLITNHLRMANQQTREQES